MSQPGDRLALAEIAAELLEMIEDYWTAVPEAEQLPGRRCLVAGLPVNVAWDCEQVTVGADLIGSGQSEDTQGAPFAPQMPGQVSPASTRHAQLTVQIVRCTPMPTANGRTTVPPTAEQIHAAGLLHMKDMGRLSQALVYIAPRMEGIVGGALVTAGRVESLGPEGDYQAVAGTLQVTVADLAP